MKDVFKNYKRYWESSRKQTQYLKDNWSFDKMVNKLNNLLKIESDKPSPWIQNVPVKLPTLKKIKS